MKRLFFWVFPFLYILWGQWMIIGDKEGKSNGGEPLQMVRKVVSFQWNKFATK
jgi:hypothetical protein